MSDSILRREYADQLKHDYLESGFKQGFEAGYAKAKEDFERPNGKWIDESKDALRCSACGKLVYKPFIGGFPTERTQHYNPNYCAFCGADMKEGEAE